MKNWLNFIIALVALIISVVLVFQVSGWKPSLVDLEKRMGGVEEKAKKVEDSLSQIQDKIQSLPVDLLDWGERLGKAITSLIDDDPVSSITNLSTPNANPP